MAVKISLYPFDFGRNKVYLHLMDRYNSYGDRSWSLADLNLRGYEFTQHILEAQFLVVQRDQHVTMAFDHPGSTSNIICRMAQEEICSFREIQRRLPKRVPFKSARLKNHLAFLSNFKRIQYFTLPCSTFTCIAADEPGFSHIESAIDEVYSISSHMEPRFLYRIDTQEGVDELRDLPLIDHI